MHLLYKNKVLHHHKEEKPFQSLFLKNFISSSSLKRIILPSMADPQRIHPVVHDPEAAVHDPEAAPHPPNVPLVPHGSSRSDKGNPEETHPPFQRTIPVTHLKPPKRRSCCRRCLCWTLCLILVVVLLLGILAAIIYFGFQPRIPRYTIDEMRITQFNLNNDNGLYAAFNVNVTARNPNRRIGIYYESGSQLSAWYSGRRLCEGSLPRFYQGHRNTTVLNLTLTGQTSNATDLLQSLQVQQQTGSIPLNLRARVPVRLRLGKLRLTRWNFLVRCRVVVDSLTADNEIRIRNSSCRFRFRL